MRNYRVHEFAALSGVTVKALHHYDRLGLLTPRRSNVGYRIYTDADLPRLQQIVALKLIGVPLKRIGPLLAREPRSIAEILRSQRDALAGGRNRLDRAIAALDRANAQLSAGRVDTTSVLSRLIREIQVENDVDLLREYFPEELWPEWRAAHGTWPSDAWVQLCRDVQDALHEPPEGPIGQTLADRWLAQDDADAGANFRMRTALRTVWKNRKRWPPAVAARLEGIDMRRVSIYISDAVVAKWDRDRAAGQPRIQHLAPASRRRLVYDFEAAMAEPLDSPTVRALVARWHDQRDRECGDDTEIRAEVEAAWRSRREWGEGVRRWVASTYEMSPQRWTRVADFIDAATRS